jgi:hypothetical protein
VTLDASFQGSDRRLRFVVIGRRAAGAEYLTIVSEVLFSPGPKRETWTLWMKASKVRQAGGDHDRIYDVASGQEIAIDHQKRVYWEGTKEEWLAKSLAAAKEVLSWPSPPPAPKLELPSHE